MPGRKLRSSQRPSGIMDLCLIRTVRSARSRWPRNLGELRNSPSRCFGRDSVEAMIDGREPKSSNDNSIPRFTWWDHRGTEEWVRYDFEKPRKVSEVDVFWFDDTGSGACRAPESWKIFYKDGE